ncbi:MAG: two-component regulator propeller domain-containing protein [Flavobacteriales bacterium]
MNQQQHILKSLLRSGFFLLLLLSMRARAQQFTFINYSTEQGLAQSQVSAMVQDKKGYLWFATFGGLSRFDGINFKNYTRKDGLIDNQLYSVFQSADGRMWIGAIGGYSLFDGVDFKAFRFPDEFSGYNVIAICEDKEGSIWFALEGGGVARRKGERLEFYGASQQLADPNVRVVFSDMAGDLWVGTRNGLFRFDFEKNAFVILSINGYTDYNVSCLTEDPNGKLWMGTYDEGVFHEEDNLEFVNYTNEEGLINNGVRTVFVDRDQQVWFGTKGGVSKFNGRTFKSFSIEQGLINNNIKFIGQDTEGNIWFGTDGKGIMKLAGEAFTTYTTSEGLSSDLVMAILEDGDKNMWFATYGEGVVRIANGQYKVFRDEDGLANNTVWSMARTNDGKIWFGTSGGLSVFDGNKFTSYYKEDGLLSNKVTSLYADRSGVLWIGNRDGLTRFSNNEFRSFSDNEGLVGGNIRGIFRDESGTFWLGSALGMYRMKGGEFKLFQHEDPSLDNTVYCITSAGKNSLWVGSKIGLYLFSGGIFSKVDLGESVNANNINFLIRDEDRLWVGTNNGIYELMAEEFMRTGKVEYRNYSRLEGVRGLESNMNAAYKDSKGSFWFGTDGGLVNYDPGKRKSTGNLFEPYIHIDDVRMYFDQVDWKKYANGIDPETGLGKDLVVPYNKNHFTFYFTGISHTNPLKVKYRFMLAGFDEEWSPVTDLRSITYSNLPYGQYTFRVIAGNGSDVWSSAPAEFSFVITPPFWLTWWFFVLVAVVAIGLVIGVYRWRISVIKQKTEREQLIYKSKLLSLEQQTLNASMNRHFIFNALNSIQYYINKQDKLEANRYLTSFAKLIRKNLDSSSTGNLVTLNEELERLELYLSLENMRFKNKFSYELYIDEDIDTEGVMIPPMLLQPYVENAIWHGILPKEQHGTIWIRIEPFEERSIRITITDDGIGITTSLKNKQNNGSDHVSRGIQINSGRLAVLKKLTNENLRIVGPYETSNEQGMVAGTCVELIIPGAGQLQADNFEESLQN